MNGGAPDTGPGHVLGGWGSGLNFNWQGVYGLNLPGFITIADLGLPVGLGGVPFLESRISVLATDAELVTLEQQDREEERHEFISDEIDRRDVSSEQESVQVALGPNTTTVLWAGAPSIIGAVAKTEDQLWFEKMFPGQVYQHPNSTILPTSPSTPTASIVSTEDNVGWISDVYSKVDEVVFGGGLPGGYIATNPYQNVGGIVGQSFGGNVGPPPGPAMPPPSTAGTTPPPPTGGPMAGACDEDPWKGYVWKKYCGEWRWVKQKRRRRKALATKTDLAGLASLKGILGNGKAFEVWIATHS